MGGSQQGLRLSVDQAKTEYAEKTAILVGCYGPEAAPRDFYRTIFPEGHLQGRFATGEGARKDGRPVAFANVIHERKRAGGLYRRNHYILDDLAGLGYYSDKVAFAAPCSFLAPKKDLEHLRHVSALVVDLDYVGPSQLDDLVHQVNCGFLPRPTYVVNSGTGMHLYYVLSEPLKVYPRMYGPLNAVKHALIDLTWNMYTSRTTDRQYSGLVQPYRMPGSRSKLDVDQETGAVVSGDYPVLAFRSGPTWGFEDLIGWRTAPDAVMTMYYNERLEKAWTRLHPESDPDHVTLEEAARRWPEWYDRRVLHNEPPKRIEDHRWHVNRRVYDWWLKRVALEAVEGHRYHCVMCLAIYALKCDVPYEELERDAMSLVPLLDGRTKNETNHFTERDVEQALLAYRSPSYVTFPIGSIEYFSGLRIERNRRNGRSQEVHLAGARAIQEINDRFNGTNWRDGNGRKPKCDEIRAYAASHPGMSNRKIAEALGVSRNTVNKWLKDVEGGRDEA